MPAQSMDELVALCKRRGFIFPASDIYGGLQGVYDYGPLGVELKNNPEGRLVARRGLSTRRRRRAGFRHPDKPQRPALLRP